MDIWDPWGEEVIFGMLHGFAYCDGFEVHNMLLDCNATNNPKYARGAPIWIRIPLATTARVDRITLRWNNGPIPGANLWRSGRAAEFSLCTRQWTNNSYVTNCASLTSTGQVDVVNVGAVTDELTLELDRRAPGIDFYGLAEIEVAGAAVSLPAATIPGGGESRLDSAHSILRAVDGDTSTAWASGPENQVQILLPLAPGTAISQLNLQWNCESIASGRLGPAADYRIQARDETTHAYYDVPFVRQNRTGKGWQTNTFGTLESTNAIVTDQLLIRLTAREAAVDYYSLSEVTLQNGSVPVAMRLPTARNTLNWGAFYTILRAFDRATDTGWASDTQGMVGAINAAGSNLKFTHLKIIGFGTKAGRECSPMYIVPSQGSYGTISNFGNVLIEDCILTEPAPNNTDGLTTVALLTASPTRLTNAVVRRCTVAGVKSHFLISDGISAIHLENCRVEDCDRGVYFEPDTNNVDNVGPVLIRSNQFVNVNSGVFVLSHPSAQFDSITCSGNDIALVGTGGWGFGAWDTSAPGTSGSITNVTALNNIIRYVDWAPRPASLDRGLFYSDIHHAVFGNNVVVLGTPSALRVREFPSGIILPPRPPKDCDQQVVVLPGDPTYPDSLDVLPPGYRRAWFNNRNLSGTLLEVRFSNWGVDGPASQQQWTQ